MAKQTFVYVTYIVSTRERVWDALIKPEFTRKYWDRDNVSDWKPGSTWEHRKVDGSGTVQLTGKVVEFDEPHRMVWTWAFPGDAASPTRVTFELEQIEDMVRLTVTHAELEPGSDMLRGITEGWPRVLSSLKSFLETGRALPTWAGKRT